MKKIILKTKEKSGFNEEIRKAEIALKIDEDDIEEEARFQPILFAKFIKNFTKAYTLSRSLELDVLRLKDNLAKDITKNPKSWGLKPDERITDALINRIVVRDEDYSSLYKQWVEAKAQEKYWENMLKACEGRGYTVNKLFEMKVKQFMGQEG